jgi:hypothetical protein
MAMFVYLVMAFWSAIALGFGTRLSAMMAQALAPTGAIMAALALLTGALWGKPTWGTYWVWDARLTSTLILLFLYIGYMALVAAIEDEQRADRAAGKKAKVRPAEDYRREVEHQAAATLLNRLVVLRRMEAAGPDGRPPLRRVAVVTGGWQSRGYADLRSLAPALVRGDDTEGYAFLLQLVFEDLAPELPGATELIEGCQALGILCSAAHTAASSPTTTHAAFVRVTAV